MIVVVTSAANQCLYCVVAHGAILRIYEKSAMIADDLATNYRKAFITDRQKAMLDFAVKICDYSHLVDETDFSTLAAHGLVTMIFGISVPSLAFLPSQIAWRV